MSLEKGVSMFAGIMVIVSALLTMFVSINFVWFSVFIGANLFQSQLTGFCPAALIIKNVFNMKSEAQIACKK
jgi:hypothetical protein